MSDFRSFTIAASVTTIVLGAGIGAALGAVSGPLSAVTGSQRAHMSTTAARPAPQAGPAMSGGTVGGGMGAGRGAPGPAIAGSGALTGPGVQRLHSMPTGKLSAVIPRSYGARRHSPATARVSPRRSPAGWAPGPAMPWQAGSPGAAPPSGAA